MAKKRMKEGSIDCLCPEFRGGLRGAKQDDNANFDDCVCEIKGNAKKITKINIQPL